jgi:hypothetical protein
MNMLTNLMMFNDVSYEKIQSAYKHISKNILQYL